MAGGTSWGINGFLQFINSIIVTLHFFGGSKLFYFCEISNFDLGLWIAGVDLVGVDIIKNHPTPTRGAPSPLGHGSRTIRGRWTISTETVRTTIYYRLYKGKVLTSWKLATSPKKTKILPKSTQNAKKKHENRLNDVIFTLWDVQKISCSKISSSIFRTNEGDFSGTPQKTNNRQNSAMNFRYRKFYRRIV